MNIFTNLFCIILAKYSPKRTKLHHFLKKFRGSMHPSPPSERVALQVCMYVCMYVFGCILLVCK